MNNMMASEGVEEGEGEGGEKTTPYPRQQTTVELLSQEDGWLAVLKQ